MKEYIWGILLMISMPSIHAQLKTPSLSPSATLRQVVGLTEIEINYARPSAKNRSIFAKEGLVPFGEIWRTGANAATKINFSDEVIIKGNTLAQGSYTILCTPNEKFWQVNWYPYKSSNWNAYVNQSPILSIEVPVSEPNSHVETFEIHIQALGLEQAEILLEWEYTSIRIPLKTLSQEKVLNNIEKMLAGPSNNDYYQAAVYLHEAHLDLDKALVYIQKVTESEKAFFFQVTREALILRDLNKKEQALQAAKKALLLSEKAENKDFVRINKRLIRSLQ